MSEAAALYFSNLWLQTAGERISHELRIAVYDHLQRLSLAFHQKRQKGDLLTRVTGDVNATGDLFAHFGVVSQQLYRGAQPADSGFAELKALGIAIVVNLRHESGRIAHERTLVERLGTRATLPGGSMSHVRRASEGHGPSRYRREARPGIAHRINV